MVRWKATVQNLTHHYSFGRTTTTLVFTGNKAPNSELCAIRLCAMGAKLHVTTYNPKLNITTLTFNNPIFN